VIKRLLAIWQTLRNRCRIEKLELLPQTEAPIQTQPRRRIRRENQGELDFELLRMSLIRKRHLEGYGHPDSIPMEMIVGNRPFKIPDRKKEDSDGKATQI